ncbi:hypothetical protein GQX73_g984 [Xylaria multiplex]|uniref:Coenzyme Q-binding protein COQ10 START domain-containing protein n=1 Tax=Xylaria multiplex TaxID=323545 RepID=A0A7C8ND58_9PEZI|nr:hypothetical protein GQX73_g984 [Xylaria multiplex]
MSPTRFLPRPTSLPFRFPPSPIRHQRRGFLSSILSSSPVPPQTLTASRRLPYNHAALYSLIADIDSYSAFLPYCSSSRVTSWTAEKDPEFGRRWPTRADLTAGWGGLEQTYTSRVFCIPGSIVEALSGEGARSGIAPDILARHGLKDEPYYSPSSTVRSGHNGEEGVFKTLVTRWSVTPVERATLDGRGGGTVLGTSRQTEWSDVNLNIRFQFTNPLYGAVSSAVADKIAPIMIEAFVERAKKVLG